MRRPLVVACVLVSAVGTSAQDELPWRPAPEVRRALPAHPEGGNTQEPENPAWMQRVEPSPPQSPGRIEVAPTVPRALPAHPSPTPAPTPESPTPAPDDPNTIRLAPAEGATDAARQQLDKANSIYARKMFDFAISEYERFLSTYPDAPGRDAAWFRLGESHRASGDAATARKAYERLLSEFHEGEFLGSASYRLGEILFTESKYEEALRLFQAAASQGGSPEVRLSAQYQAGRCLDRLGRLGDATALFREVAAAEGNNPYRAYARLALAEALAAAGQKQEALTEFDQMIASTPPESLRPELFVKAGSVASQLGDSAKAIASFQEVLKMPDAGRWRPVALLGLLRSHAALGDQDALTAIPESDLDVLSGEYRAEAYSLLASAWRTKGDNAKALALYDRLASDFPQTQAARASRFARIIVLRELNDPRWQNDLAEFLASAEDSPDRGRGHLLLAELYFQQEKFSEAAKAYADALASPLGNSDDLRRQAQFKYAWSLAQSGNPAAAIAAYTDFLAKNSGDKLVATALTQRALARQQTQDFDGALKDFDDALTALSKTAPQSPEREFALQQKALLLGQLGKTSEMQAAFRQLLEEFPQSNGTAQAEYWLGWADFEAKEYARALPHLQRARELDPKTFGDRAGLRIALCHYYAEDSQALESEVATLRPEVVPPEVFRWLGLRSAQDGHSVQTEKYLDRAVRAGAADPESLITLAEARNVIGKNQEALEAANDYLAKVTDPAPRARGFLAIAESRRGLKEFDAARDAADEALRLQPEGRLNAAGRLTLGEIEFSREDFAAAARAFSSVALLYEDPHITPRALQRAAESYQKAGNVEEAQKAEEELARRFPNFKK